MDFQAAQPPCDGRRESQRNRIDIALHSMNRGDGAELVEYNLRPNVTGMQDFINTAQ